MSGLGVKLVGLRSRGGSVGLRVAVVVLVALALGASASAASPAPGWEVTSRAYPTNLKPGGTGMVEIDVVNTGAASSSGKVSVTDMLPAGLEATEAGPMGPAGNITVEEIEEREEEEAAQEKRESEGKRGGEEGGEVRVWGCSGTTVVTCTTVPGFGGVLRPIRPGFLVRIGIAVKVAPGVSGTGVNEVSAIGGGAVGTADSAAPLTFSSATPGFGLAGFDGWFTNADGTVDTQAGSHPYEATFGFDLNAVEGRSAGGGLRDLQLALPPGMIGDPHAVPQCTRQQFLSGIVGGCPPSTEIGVDWAGLSPFGEAGFASTLFRFPVYNLVPPPGVPAEFGFTAEGVNILIEAVVRSGGDYGISGRVHDLGYHPVQDTIMLWGVPAEESHNLQRCGIANLGGSIGCGYSAGGAAPRPLLTMPTSCEGPLALGIHVDSWSATSIASESASFLMHDPTGAPVGFTGCEHLGFGPQLSVAPDTTYADTPAGLTVQVKVPQESLTSPEGLATADIKNTTVTLPEGVAINPGAAAGLAACGPVEDGLTTEAEKAAGEEDNGPAHCPNASKVGTDEVETPLLSKSLKGNVYVLQSEPPHVRLLVAAEGEGVFLKLVGTVNLDERTGRITTTFEETPGLPFTAFRLSFSGGAQAALSTPTGCGTYTTASDFTPWSSPFVEDAFPSGSFVIEHGAGGASCPSLPLPFAPSMIAGATTDQAGGYTDFSLLLTRPDDQQRISRLQFKAPPGLLGMVSHVSLCEEPQASKGECPASSQIGHTVVGAGAGPYPLFVPEAGKPEAPIYIGGEYEGAPYSLVIAVPVLVGPFDLGTTVVRGRIEVDPQTAQLTITTDPLPVVLKGVPADLRTIDAVIDRKEFMFNPTNCDPQSFSGTAFSTEGATAPLSSPFQVGSCRSLQFKPTFKVSTSAHASRTQGVALHVALDLPDEGGLSSEANVRRVRVSLPKQLPSPLKTLQKACLEKTFEANPNNCPVASQVGTVKVQTPVLPGGLTGTAYFVSHGGAKYPELIMVLVGQNGVTQQVHGETFISKQGITTATFATVPDVPFSSFELELPQREYPAITANGNLCKAQASGKLVMPTELAGQNGLVIKQNTKITVSGCPKVVRHERKKAHKKRSATRSKTGHKARGKKKR